MEVNGHEVQIKAIRSDGAEWYYNSDDWGITGLTGLDSSPVEIFRSNKGFGDGSFITGKRKGEREIQIVAKCKTIHNNAENRAQCIAFHNSNHTYQLEITYLGKTRIVGRVRTSAGNYYSKGICEMLAFKLPTGNIHGRLELTVDYLSPDPDLTSSEAYYADTATETNLWHANYAYAAGGKLSYGVASKNTEHSLFYDGTEKTPLDILIHFNKSVSSPMHISVNGEEITSYAGLQNPSQFGVGSELWMCGDSGRIFMFDTNDTWINLVQSWHDPKMFLQIGDNTIKVWDDAGQNDYGIKIRFDGRYGGI